MSILQIIRNEAAAVGILPGNVYMVSTDDYATVTSAGYVPNNRSDFEVSPNDVFYTLYSFDPVLDTPSFAFFTPDFSSGTITLVPIATTGNVVGPVTVGDFAVFANSGGDISDGGTPGQAAFKNVTDNTKALVSSVSGATVVGHFAAFADTTGTVTDSAVQPSNNTYARVSSVNGSTVVGNIPVFNDLLGSIQDSGIPASASLFVWNGVTGTSQTIAPSNGYWTENVALTTFTLPATMPAGEIFEIAGVSAPGWTIAQGAGQQIRAGNVQTTSGAGGSLSSTAQGDCVRILCDTTNTHFTVLDMQGNLTVA